jgi:uncharacterized protein YndB with AHSA1/START domain
VDQSVISLGAQQIQPMLEIRHSTLIRADPMQIYAALTTFEGLDAWFTSGAQVDAHPG